MRQHRYSAWQPYGAHIGRALGLLLAVSIALPACSGGSTVTPGAGPVSTPTAPSSTGPTATPSATPTATPSPASVSLTGLQPGATRSGIVALPSGVSFAGTGALTAANSFGTTTIAPSGSFTVDTMTNDPQLVTINSSGGASLLSGWLGASEPVVNAHTTAEVYLYYATFVYTIPDAGARAKVIASIQTLPGLSSVEGAIGSALKAHPTLSPGNDPGVKNAITSLVAALTMSSAMHLEAARGIASMTRILGGRRPDSLGVMPGLSASGITIIPGDANTLQFQNTLRRGAVAFVDEISHVNAAGNTIDDQANDTNPPVPIAPENGIGSFLGAITDYLNGNYAIVPTLSPVVEVPNVAGAKSTLYRVAIAGPGVKAGDLASLTDVEKAAGVAEGNKTLIFEVILPLVASVLVPNVKIGTLTEEAAEANNLAAAALGDVLAALASDGRIQTAAETGDLKALYSAVLADVTQLVTVTEGLTKLALYLCHVTLTQGTQIKTDVANVIEGVAPILRVTDGIIAIVDTLAIIKDESSADKGDVFMITVKDPTTTLLTPDGKTSASIDKLASVTLTTALHPPITAPLIYHYQTAGIFGTLTDGAGQTNNFTSSYATVTYTGGASGGGSDKITVTPIVHEMGQPDEDLEPASATVAVAVTPTPSPAPPSCSTAGGPCGTATVTGSYDGGPNAGQSIKQTEIVAQDGRSQNAFGASVPPYFAGTVTIEIPQYFPGQTIVDGTSTFSSDDFPCARGFAGQSGAGGHTFTAIFPSNGQPYSLPDNGPGGNYRYGCSEFIYAKAPAGQNQGYQGLNFFYGAFPPGNGPPGSFAARGIGNGRLMRPHRTR